jgi:hypothetical protein
MRGRPFSISVGAQVQKLMGRGEIKKKRVINFKIINK